jgi:hypothetical protein
MIMMGKWRVRSSEQTCEQSRKPSACSRLRLTIIKAKLPSGRHMLIPERIDDPLGGAIARPGECARRARHFRASPMAAAKPICSSVAARISISSVSIFRRES